MKIWVATFIFIGACIPNARSEVTEIEAGQVWSANVPSAPNLRVFIGKVDDETDSILHVGLSGLPDLNRSPSVLEELSPGKPIAETHKSCMSCMSHVQKDFYFTFDMAPNFTHSAVALKVLYLPIERAALVSDLNSVVASNVVATPSFKGAWDSWDYLRDNYGLENQTSRIAKQPLVDLIKVVSRTANAKLNFLEKNKDQIGKIDDKVYFETTVETIEPRSEAN